MEISFFFNLNELRMHATSDLFCVFSFIPISMQSEPITTDVVSSNLDQGEVYNIM